MNVAVPDDYIPRVDADTKFDALLLRGRGVALGQAALHGNGARHGLNDARELDQDAVAGGLDDAALTLDDLRVDKFRDPAVLGEPAYRPRPDP